VDGEHKGIMKRFVGVVEGTIDKYVCVESVP
jgi:hypothetical protein